MQLRSAGGTNYAYNSMGPQSPLQKLKPMTISPTSPKHLYYESNPYLLSPTHADSKVKMNFHTMQAPREQSEASSAASVRMIRANVLRNANKPTLYRTSTSQDHPLRKPIEQNKIYKRTYELQAQNKRLHDENNYLREQMRKMQQGKNMEIAALTERTEKLSNLAGELQEKIGKGEEEWREWLKQLGLDNSSRVRNGKK